MLPRGHRGIVVCGTRRAEHWRAAFRASGIEAVVVETEGDEAEGGACQVGVPEARLVQANAIVTEVTSGKRRLPGDGFGWRSVVVVLLVGALIAAMLAR
jgi:hypothetical protein